MHDMTTTTQQQQQLTSLHEPPKTTNGWDYVLRMRCLSSTRTTSAWQHP